MASGIKDSAPHKKASVISRVEKEVIPSEKALPTAAPVDTLDSDRFGYVVQFLNDLAKIPPMQRLDLTSPQAALQAIAVLDRRLDELRVHRRQAAAIKRMLKQS